MRISRKDAPQIQPALRGCQVKSAVPKHFLASSVARFPAAHCPPARKSIAAAIRDRPETKMAPGRAPTTPKKTAGSRQHNVNPQ
jgi:hypothetical protein